MVAVIGCRLTPVSEATSGPDVEERTTEIRESGTSLAPSRRWRLDTPRVESLAVVVAIISQHTERKALEITE